jgi:RIO kinase 1
VALWDEEDTATYERFHDSREKSRKAKREAQAVATLTDTRVSLDTEKPWTYTPTKKEKEWLSEALESFFKHNPPLIDDVLFSVKGGKEASVYCCHVPAEARQIAGSECLAAKVYRPRMFRSLRNDALYRTGRAIMTGVMKDYMRESRGKQIDRVDERMARAVKNKTKFGTEIQSTSWLTYEYNTLLALASEGCAVPKPISLSPNAILMTYCGTKTRGAATLIEVGLNRREAARVFDEVKRNLTILAGFELVHGDLSAYNILYHEGEILLIDFPQVVRFGENPYVEDILMRDLTRLCEYFQRCGIPCDPWQLRKEVGYPNLD